MITFSTPTHFAIRDKEPFQTRTKNFIGCCGFTDIKVGHSARIGYCLGRDYWGYGITPAVVSVLCEYAFFHWELVKIIGEVFSFNEQSERVLNKCGFELEATLRKHRRKDQKFIDCKIYSLFKKETCDGKKELSGLPMD